MSADLDAVASLQLSPLSRPWHVLTAGIHPVQSHAMKWERQRHLGLTIFIAVSLFAYGDMVRLQRNHGGPLDGSPLLQTIALYLLASLAFLAMLVWIERRGGVSTKAIWGIAVIFRLLFLFASPALSDDVYRYLWDGHLADRGVSPYQYAVNSPALDELEIPLRQLVNHSWMATPYLPGAQILFRTLALFLPLKPLFIQVAMLACDLLSAWLITKLLALASLPRRRVIIYLWNPLVIVEVTYNAHIDAWMILLTLMAVYISLSRPRHAARSTISNVPYAIPYLGVLAPFFLALATLTKLLPVLLLPVLFWRWSWRQRVLYVVATVGLLLPTGMRSGWGLTGELSGTGLFGATRIYIDRWNFNSGLFHWLERSLMASGFGRALVAAKILVLAIMLIILFALWLVARRQESALDSARLMMVPIALYILLSPTLHPWYLLILLAFLPFWPPENDEPRRLWLPVIPWLYLGAVLALSYATYFDPVSPGELEWIRQVEWLPTLLALTFTSAKLLILRARSLRGRQGGLPAVLHN